MDISIFKDIYVKQDLFAIDEVFKPYSYLEWGINSFKNEPFGNHTESVFDNAFYNFAYFDEFEVTHDAVTMNEMVGTSNEKLVNLDIEIEYQQIEQICEISDLESEFSIFLGKHEKEYLSVLKQNFLDAPTNIRASILMESQLSALSDSYSSLDELESLIDLNTIEELLIRQYKQSYSVLFKAIKKSYTSTFANLIQEVDPIFRHIEPNSPKPSNKTYGNGLILYDGCNMTAHRALTFCNSLIKHDFIKDGTRGDTFRNLFKRDVSEKIVTQVEWIGTVPQLKYLIEFLLDKNIIKESGYQKKWKDASNCFYKKGLKIDNKTFSKNSDSVPKTSKDQLKRILENLKAQFPEKQK